jgi:hypothetical protein
MPYEVGVQVVVRCADCSHARVGREETCYCNMGKWDNRLLKNVNLLRQRCELYETVGEEVQA